MAMLKGSVFNTKQVLLFLQIRLLANSHLNLQTGLLVRSGL